MKMFGIKNCDTIKKAKKWLESENIAFSFHDYKKDGLEKSQVLEWVSTLGWEALINKRGTTWRKLPDDVKDSINESIAVELMLDNPSIIKRPLLEHNDQRLLGFNEDDYKDFVRR